MSKEADGSKLALTSLAMVYGQACELYAIPESAPLDFVGRGPGFSSFSAGFLPRPREGAQLIHATHTVVKLLSPAMPILRQ